tara:strand:- start:396 stop:740 length:345 start_codon:yes stop_codon:yes gene_type:complete
METKITFTKSASRYIASMLAKKPGTHFRISIKKTGCSGYSYLPTMTESVNPTDTCIQVTTDLPIYLDTTWLHLLEGVHIDYLEEDKTGLKQKKLIFTNEKEAGRCGCGESFHIE